MDENLPDTNVGNIEYIRRKDAVDAVKHAWAKGIEPSQYIESLEPADVAPVVRCKDCEHNNDCDIQYSAQAGENFFCGFSETEKDEREDVYE